LSNPYVNRQSVRRLGELAAEHRAVRNAVAAHVSRVGVASGYSAGVVRGLQQKLLLVCAPAVQKLAWEAIDAIAKDYEKAYDDLPADKKQRLGGDFTSAISERIVREYLVAHGRLPADMQWNARIYLHGKPLNKSNIDFVWWVGHRKIADAYECKNDPMRLLGPYAGREHNQHSYPKTQLWLLLEFDSRLTAIGWDIHIACVTLRRRHAVQRRLADLVELSDRVRVYTVDDFGEDFPPVR